MGMNISFYTARTGMIAQQQGLNVYSNNIANINTIGYKPLRPSFAECIYTLQHPPREQWQTGHGQWLNKTDLMWEQGGLLASDSPLDYAIPGYDFFMTLDRDGNTYLTRDGRFALSFTGEQWELVNGFGDFVLDYDMNRIAVPFMLDNDGNPTTTIDYAALLEMIGVFSVPNNWGLDQAENNRFIVTERSGAAAANPEADKLEGVIELSAVDFAGDMVRIIETQRSYQFNAKIVQVSDEIMKTVNSLR
jgi:flagellar basal-body rod protein FlgG